MTRDVVPMLREKQTQKGIVVGRLCAAGRESEVVRPDGPAERVRVQFHADLETQQAFEDGELAVENELAQHGLGAREPAVLVDVRLRGEQRE